ncbi:MAG TPA: prepilin-type N-terminal cleavage/methylation domain-containing protein [Candidatus Saccharimonadales bacterium]|nr:prepilin-type N-terminal cleavage/methylation domain-containing protein [Candidatus Saccharimonadales bacterium]
MKNLKFKTTGGFTLIELLIVIAIIGILSAIFVGSYVFVQTKSRDGQRKSDMQQLRSALESYHADWSKYPLSGPQSACSINGAYYGGGYQTLPPFSCGAPFTSPDGKTVYANKVPCTPNSTCGYNYTSTDGNTYKIETCIETATDTDQNTAPNTNCPSGKEYLITNP